MDMSTGEPRASKRQRTRRACTPCRVRKRKCEGRDPCDTCIAWGYECHYEPHEDKTQPTTSPKPAVQQSISSKAATAPKNESEGRLVQRMEANSGAAFVRKLGLKIDPAKAPQLNLFGWNIGFRKPSSDLGVENLPPLSVVEITSLEHMRSLAQVYFDKVDPCYGFLDRHQFFNRLTARFEPHATSDIYDSVLCGVAGLGCFFSQRNVTAIELHFIRTARLVLEAFPLCGPPPLGLLNAWTLKTIYLRLTSSPHSTWMASSSLMHLVEAAGLYPEAPQGSILPARIKCDPDLQRRIVGVAHHLNIWTSFDLGLSRVSFQKNDLPLPPAPRPGDYTCEVLGLLPVSVSLDPGQTKNETDLTSTLSDLLEGRHTQPPSVLAQCNLTLCILRRIHSQSLHIPQMLAEKALALFKKGLDCARKMVLDSSPWHQVANVPFNIICVLLVLDTRSSLALLPGAMQTLSLVASAYETETTREAYNTAGLLVLLHQQRRKDDISVFSQALNVHQETRIGLPSQQDPSAEEYSWLGALVADLPGLQGLDLDQFLNVDMMAGINGLGGSA
ncbi:hypothetical protein N7492_001076 [Penicillium capsulatum]|uniref:Zn(2)-C6 fungal-type domain-containing protein n=1 Tax=Penicillium capsulatum TaxID=69766 RepID=A0A9W9LZK0_9EURO|nr:hypothetical protein N7492_001076 [Penicillium capsulatum]KAJ6129865.1 hypothetical protein N7512_002645 [Penicillium capsulatum]